MNVKIFFCLILSLLFVSDTKAQQIFQVNDNLYKTREIKKTLPLSKESNIKIQAAMGLSGSIKIETTEEDVATIIYVKKAKHKSKSKAIDFIDIISVEFELTHNGLRLDLRAPNPAPWSETNNSGSVEVLLIIPEFCNLEFDAQAFDIDAEGPFDSFILPTSYGRIYLENVVNKVEITSTNRKVTARNLSGSVYISTSHATLQVDKVYSPQNKIELRNDRGDIKISDIKGELNVKNSYGRIDVRKYHPMGSYNYIRSSNGPITIEIDEFSTNKLLVTNSYEDIEILIPDNISSQISLAVEEGNKIEVSDITTKPDFIQSNRLNLIAGEGKATINSSVRGHGNIYFRGFSKGE